MEDLLKNGTIYFFAKSLGYYTGIEINFSILYQIIDIITRILSLFTFLYPKIVEYYIYVLWAFYFYLFYSILLRTLSRILIEKIFDFFYKIISKCFDFFIVNFLRFLITTLFNITFNFFWGVGIMFLEIFHLIQTLEWKRFQEIKYISKIKINEDIKLPSQIKEYIEVNENEVSKNESIIQHGENITKINIKKSLF